tara:strand:+ start:129 stop:584 length:456 start_codon:yes stop_codon:yes gene_type:complete
MTDYKMWRDLPYYVKDRMRKQFVSGTEFEMSYNGENWFEMSRATSFSNSSYYRVKGETSMTNLSMISFGNLDPVKQGEILVAHRNNKLMMWSEDQQQWTLVCSNCVYDSIVYCIKAAPRECYVKLNAAGFSVETAPYKFDGAILMREVMED